MALAGCAATDMVQVRTPRKGPVAGVGIVDPGGGHIRYPLKGPERVVRNRRKAAYRKMAQQCGGKTLFRVKREYSREDDSTPFDSTDLEAEKLMADEHYQVEDHRHILFECVKKTE